MKIGIIRETKIPVDNRTPLSPSQVSYLKNKYPLHQIVVQASNVRAFTDDEYRSVGVDVVDNLEDCDILFGIKEAKIDTLIPNKQYFFFGHIAKMQEYNKPLLKAFMEKHITFCDYEYLVDSENKRVCAFGWWAGVVGCYYTLRGYGIKTGLYRLPAPDINFTLDKLIESLCEVPLPSIKLLVTGTGRVSQGVQFVLNKIGAKELGENEYLNMQKPKSLVYTVAGLSQLVTSKSEMPFDHSEFKNNPYSYKSDFMRWAEATDILLSAHFWGDNDPVYLNCDELRDSQLRIKFIGDITCDIKGSIKSTVRSSTHDNPFYDYNPYTESEEPAFSSDRNISVMAVDTCPNALALDTSTYFGDLLIKHVFEPLLNGKLSDVINGAKILDKGLLTSKFSYLKDFAEK